MIGDFFVPTDSRFTDISIGRILLVCNDGFDFFVPTADLFFVPAAMHLCVELLKNYEKLSLIMFIS